MSKIQTIICRHPSETKRFRVTFTELVFFLIWLFALFWVTLKDCNGTVTRRNADDLTASNGTIAIVNDGTE